MLAEVWPLLNITLVGANHVQHDSGMAGWHSKQQACRPRAAAPRPRTVCVGGCAGCYDSQLGYKPAQHKHAMRHPAEVEHCWSVQQSGPSCHPSSVSSGMLDAMWLIAVAQRLASSGHSSRLTQARVGVSQSPAVAGQALGARQQGRTTAGRAASGRTSARLSAAGSENLPAS